MIVSLIVDAVYVIRKELEAGILDPFLLEKDDLTCFHAREDHTE